MALNIEFRTQENQRAHINVLSPKVLRGTCASIKIDAVMNVRASVSPIAMVSTASFTTTRRAPADMRYPRVTNRTYAHMRYTIITHVVILHSTNFYATVIGDTSCHAVPRTLCITPPQAERRTSCDP